MKMKKTQNKKMIKMNILQYLINKGRKKSQHNKALAK